MEVSSEMYLRRQDIAITGHEDIHNLYQFMKLMLKYIGANDVDTTYISHEIVYELISCDFLSCVMKQQIYPTKNSLVFVSDGLISALPFTRMWWD